MMTPRHLARLMFRLVRHTSVFLLGLLFPLLAAQGQTASPATASGSSSPGGGQASAPLSQETAPLQISAGDLLDVEIFDTPELSVGRARVSQDGLIRVPVVGDINVNRLSPVEAASRIEATLRQQQIMLDPHVTVFVNEYSSQGVRVLGQVRSPGTYTLLGQHSLEDALSAAGGTTAEQGGTISITHANDLSHPYVLDVYSAQNADLERRTQVRPGDVVIVSKASPFYVTGDVGEPGQYLIGNGRPITLVEGIALAHGATNTAALTHAAILRKTPAGVVRIPINLKRVEQNADPDLLLQADDIVIVPHSALKQAAQYAIPYAAGIVIGAAVSKGIQ